MKSFEKIYNCDNLSDSEINEKTTRTRAILINSNNEILMCYSNGLSHYEFPGGHLEENETLNEGLKREILEETGIEINTYDLEPFFCIKYYCKNYHNSGRNRLVEIYYYIINGDYVYDIDKRSLGKNEIEEKYECVYIESSKLKNILIENKKTTKENNSALDDMILVWDKYLNMR